MDIFQYWAKRTGQGKNNQGKDWLLTSWAGSNLTMEDAIAHADSKLASMQQRLQKNYELEPYPYSADGHAVREQVLERFGNPESPYAAITRNRYGAKVLNTANLFFADVDLAIDKEPWKIPLPEHRDKPMGKSGFFSCLFGGNKKKSYNQLRTEQQADIQQRFASFHEKNQTLNIRLYETAAGYRAIIGNQSVTPQDELSNEWMTSLACDPLYRTLCVKQQCYRARLTPKPWRLPSYIRAVFYPDNHNELSDELPEWLRGYEAQSDKVAVCKLVKAYGDSGENLGSMNPEARDVISLHDQYVLNDLASELA